MVLSVNISLDLDRHAATGHATVTADAPHQVTDGEAAAFGVDTEALREAFAAHLGSGLPDRVYLHGPTPPYGDLYARYGSPPVRTQLDEPTVTVLGPTARERIVWWRGLRNKDATPTTITVEPHKAAQIRLSADWTGAAGLPLDDEVAYAVTASVGNRAAGGSTEVRTRWGHSIERDWPVELSLRPSTLRLLPGERLDVGMAAMVSILQIRIDYSAHLHGHVMAAFDTPYAGYRHWTIPIAALARVTGIRKHLPAAQVIGLRWPHSPRLTIGDDAGIADRHPPDASPAG